VLRRRRRLVCRLASFAHNGFQRGFRQCVLPQKVLEVSAGELASFRIADDFGVFEFVFGVARRKDHVEGREGRSGILPASTTVSKDLVAEALVRIGRRDLHHQHLAAEFRRQPLERRRRRGLGGKDDGQWQSKPCGLGAEAVVVVGAELDALDIVRQLRLEEFAQVAGLALPVLVIDHGLFGGVPGFAGLALGREEPDRGRSRILAEHPGGSRSLLLCVPIGDGDHALDGCRQLLPFWLEKLAVSSSLPADVDQYRVGIVQDVLFPVRRREGHHVRGKQIVVGGGGTSAEDGEEGDHRGRKKPKAHAGAVTPEEWWCGPHSSTRLV